MKNSYTARSMVYVVELLRSSDKEDAFLPQVTLRLRGITHIERLPAFLQPTTLDAMPNGGEEDILNGADYNIDVASGLNLGLNFPSKSKQNPIERQ